ncbi:uncharacterized protein A4U43_C02F19620 [Asparagus officinalis]|uniref:Uncharacterized protein n=1 Tax=Asparagus officinalis TaxID=4686 RepID=A0A5P1FJR2_ASPOF|nr:uncharacterized protein A4U43_C02F19620 [Asparagus officinalis]
MKTLQIPTSTPSKLTQRSAPNSPIRHIHSSFPYYFYSTPSTPNTQGLSSFVASCESRLRELGTSESNSDIEGHEFKFIGQSVSFNCTPISLATADDLFLNGKLIPSEPLLTPSPLKLPPRLQYIKSIRKSLRITKSFNDKRSPRKTSPDFDPFAIAMKTVITENGPWCQVSKNHRRAKSYEHMLLDVDQMWDNGDTKISMVNKRSKILNYFKGGKNDGWKKARKRMRIYEYIKRVAKGKGKSENIVSSEKTLMMKEPNRIRTLANYKQSENHQTLLACLGWGT